MTHSPRWGLLLACCVTLATLGLYVPVASAQPAHCKKGVCTPRSHLPWKSPASISDGVAATFRSIKRCPDVRPDGSPIQGVRMVEVDVIFSSGAGGMGDVAPVNADGSWTLVKTFDAGGTIDLSATVHAQCIDLTDFATDIADYRPHRIAVNP